MSTLRAPRFFGSSVLESCLSGHRIFAGSGDPPDAVAQLQQALADLGFAVAPSGVFDGATAEAIAEYKTGKALVPTDPVVGPGTMAALDSDFAHELFDAKAAALAGTRFDLGLRLAARVDLGDGFATCRFQKGTCMELAHARVYALPATVMDAWVSAGAITGAFGLPAGDPLELDAVRAAQEFAFVTVVFTALTAFVLPRAIWEASVAGQGLIGAPIGPPLPAGTGGATFTQHDRGVVLAAPESSPQPLPQAVFDLWLGQELSVTNVQDGFFARFEPVTAPVIVPLFDLKVSPGESIERLVVRSNSGQTPAQYLSAMTSFEGNPSGDCIETAPFRVADFRAVAERHIAAPKTGAELAETHGMFDAMSPADAASARALTGSAATVEPGDRLNTPYLPDPFAIGACFVSLPGRTLSPPVSNDPNVQIRQLLNELVNQVPFALPGDAWPETRSFRLRAEGIEQDATPALPRFDSGTRTLTVQVPQAEVVRFRLSSFSGDAANLDLMGIWRWIEEGIGKLPGTAEERAGMLNATRGLAANGLHWMLTPFREIAVVHAVQQPLIEPDFLALFPVRSFGETAARFEGVIRCDGKSTGQLDVVADWDEPLDDRTDPAGPHFAGGPQAPIPHHAHAFAFPLNFKGPIPLDKPAELIDAARPIGAYDHTRRELRFTNESTNENLPRHVFGDTRYRRVGYTAVGTTRFSEYFPCAIRNTAGALVRRSAPALLHVPSSARPDAPKVLYIVPAFRWDRKSENPGTATSIRHGGGLRVYLDRPWFSSGDGEMLGVVLWTGQLPEDPDLLNQIKPYTTRWGLDPVWTQKPLRPNLAPGDFVLAKTLDPLESKTTGLTIDELNLPNEGLRAPFSVAPHEVAYDQVRGLWYCEIEIDPGVAYTPFVRLALARYQPHSVDDRYLSRIALADFAQLTPERTASITHLNDGRTLISVHGKAFAESRDAGENRVTATVQQRTNADPVLGWTDVGEPINLRRQTAETVQLDSWSGALTAPENFAPGTLRLLIREFERYRSDGSPGDQGNAEFSERLVFAEGLDL